MVVVVVVEDILAGSIDSMLFFVTFAPEILLLILLKFMVKDDKNVTRGKLLNY